MIHPRHLPQVATLPILAWVALCCASLACRSVSQPSTPTVGGTEPPPSAKTLPRYGCQPTVERMEILVGTQPIPKNLIQEKPQRSANDFDPNLFLTALPHLSMAPGYTLDYVYYFDGFGGGPQVYARPKDQAPYTSVKEYQAALGTGSLARTAYLQHIQGDGSPEAFLELVLLRILGDRFYLYWHSNYGTVEVICDPARLANLVDELADGVYGAKMEPKDQIQANALSTQPVIHLDENQATVELLTFTRFGGFSRETYTITSQSPYRILAEKVEKLVPYESGIQF